MLCPYVNPGYRLGVLHSIMGTKLHYRRSIRMKNFDYSASGEYFVTICTQGREQVFGKIQNGISVLSPAGQMVSAWWTEINRMHPMVETEAYVVMPDHFHGIIRLLDWNETVGADPCVCPGSNGNVPADLCVCPGSNGNVCPMYETPNDPKGGHVGPPLPKIIQWFKTMTTNAYIQNVRQCNWPPFVGRLWQRNYYEHIIRDEQEMRRLREYIVQNPLKWASDEINRAINV